MLKWQRKKTVKKKKSKDGAGTSAMINCCGLLISVSLHRVLVYSSEHPPVVTTAAVLSVGAAKTRSDCRVHIQEASKQARKFNGCV